MFSINLSGLPDPNAAAVLLASLTSFEAWLMFRMAYKKQYRERPSLAARLRSKWNGLMPVQRKVFVILAIIGLVYFLFFHPNQPVSE